MSDKSRKVAVFVLRAAIGLGLLGALLSAIELDELVRLAADLRWPWLLAAAAIVLGLRVLMSLRWQIVLASEGVHVPLGELIRITFIGMFIGHFLPGGMGVDVVRGYELISRRGRTAEVASTLAIDRCIGIYSMFTLALVGAGFMAAAGRGVGFLLGLGIVQVVIVVGWLVACALAARLQRYAPGGDGRWPRLWRKLMQVVASIADLDRLRRIFARMLTLSLVVQLGRCLMFLCLYRSLNAAVGVVDCVTLIPLVYIIVMIPVSIGGLGVREGALAYFFADLGVAVAVSVAVGLLSHVMRMVVALPGIFFWIFKRRTTKAGE